MNSILPMDELNRLDAQLRERFGYEQLPQDKSVMREVEDLLEDLFLFAYAMGNEVTNDNLAPSHAVGYTSYTPTVDEVMETVDAKVAGKNWRERVEDYFSNGGTGVDISRIAATETHRIANAAAFNTAKAAGATEKVWHCMMLPTSRDDHIWLDGVSAPIDGVFYNENGDTTRYPGEWGIPEQDVNCLCWLTFR